MRPLKFARHLPQAGWAPVVLADLRADEATNEELLSAVPDTAVVLRDYARATIQVPGIRRAARARPEPVVPTTSAPATSAVGASAAARDGANRWLALRRRVATWNDYASRQPWYPGPEWLPLGRHSIDMPHALTAARRALSQYPACEAIMVNADPFAALLVGARLARETGLPLISDLRDPWALCELRRPQRPAPQRWLVDKLERQVIEASACVILNSDGALDAYRAHYADIPEGRFVRLRNHVDPTLIAGGTWVEPPEDRLRLLFLGHLRRFVRGEMVLDALSRLSPAGAGRLPVELVVSGQVTPEARQLAERLGIAGMLKSHPFVPYTEIGGFMHSAHGLLVLNATSTEAGSAPTPQRIPAKLYDYLASDRPIITIADTPEITRMIAGMAGVHPVANDDVAGLVRVIEGLRAAPPRTPIVRALGDLDSRAASRRLAEVLERVVERGRSGSQAA